MVYKGNKAGRLKADHIMKLKDSNNVILFDARGAAAKAP
jgi:hypothetical protein